MPAGNADTGNDRGLIPLFKVFMAKEAAGYVAETLASGYIGQGPKVERFEERLKEKLILSQRPLTTSSCTAALDLAYHLIGIGPGAEVISTPMTCFATNAPLVHRGAKIVWADVDPTTGLIDPDSVNRKITRKTKAIVAVDWAGRPCDYKMLMQLGVPVVRDAAHSIKAGPPDFWNEGADYVCWSFQAIKHLTTGDGGALLCPKEDVERAKLLRWFGLDRTNGDRCDQMISDVGFKYHMNDIAASIGLANLQTLPQRVACHRRNAAAIALALGEPFIQSSSYWFYPYRTKRRADFVGFMRERGIVAGRTHTANDIFPALRPFYNDGLRGVKEFEATNVAIPCGWWLSEEDLERITNALAAWNEVERRAA